MLAGGQVDALRSLQHIAAFGRIPRHGGLDLLSDHGLATGGTREQMQQLADSLRAEAQQQIAAMNVDSSF